MQIDISHVTGHRGLYPFWVLGLSPRQKLQGSKKPRHLISISIATALVDQVLCLLDFPHWKPGTVSGVARILNFPLGDAMRF